VARNVPSEVAAIRREIERFLNTRDEQGRIVGDAKYGVYAFYDYDGEPIYVGQTTEKLRTRIRRHLTNQRTDAVAMNVLDPFEVAEVEMWPFIGLRGSEAAEVLGRAEYTVFQKVLSESAMGAVLNEKDIAQAEPIELPRSFRSRIVPEEIYELRKHADIRIARRASTVANLARVISERSVSKGLRRTLLTQARRLERLAAQRMAEIDQAYPVEGPGEETGETDAGPQ
jgi:hypothetical protein